MGSNVKIAIARGFSLKNCGRLTVTFTKYLISASPGNPANDGGSAALMWCVAAVANSGIALEKETLARGFCDA
jgi:hypothetical protein